MCYRTAKQMQGGDPSVARSQRKKEARAYSRTTCKTDRHRAGQLSAYRARTTPVYDDCLQARKRSGATGRRTVSSHICAAGQQYGQRSLYIVSAIAQHLNLRTCERRWNLCDERFREKRPFVGPLICVIDAYESRGRLGGGQACAEGSV